MTNSEPPKEVGALGDRMIAAFARLNTSLRAMFDLLRQLIDSSDKSASRREKEFEALRQLLVDIKQEIILLSSNLKNVKEDVDDVKENTDPRIVLARAEGERVNKDSGPFHISHGKIRFALPTSWVGWVLTVAVSAGVGGVILRGVQWLIGK